jgi:hypothetical protein
MSYGVVALPRSATGIGVRLPYKANHLLLFREMITVNCDIDTVDISTVSAQCRIFNFNAGSEKG